jgi:hypothetical protein
MMTFRGRLRRLINRDVQIATSVGLYEGRIYEVSSRWLKMYLSSAPGYPPVKVTVFLQAIAFVRVV